MILKVLRLGSMGRTRSARVRPGETARFGVLRQRLQQIYHTDAAQRLGMGCRTPLLAPRAGDAEIALWIPSPLLMCHEHDFQRRHSGGAPNAHHTTRTHKAFARRPRTDKIHTFALLYHLILTDSVCWFFAGMHNSAPISTMSWGSPPTGDASVADFAG